MLWQIARWLQRWKIQKRQTIVNEELRDLHSLTVSFHGRYLLSRVCSDFENGLDPKIRRMYWVLLQTAPLQEWSSRN